MDNGGYKGLGLDAPADGEEVIHRLSEREECLRALDR